jgi:hypothetical protein
MRYALACTVFAGIMLCGFQQGTAPKNGKPKQKPTDAAQQDNKGNKQDCNNSSAGQSSSKTTDENSGREKCDDNQNVYIAAPEKSVDSVEHIISIVGVVCTIALTAVGIIGICVAIKTLKALKIQAAAMRRQTRHIARQALSMRRQTTLLRESSEAAKRSADAYIAAERAWLFVELVPAAHLYSDGRWYRYSAEGRPIGMSDKEVAAGEHLQQTIRITNMGRTPGIITRYQIAVTGEEENSPARVVVSGNPYHSLAGEKSLDINWDTLDAFEFIQGHRIVVFVGDVIYHHVFDKFKTDEQRFVYVFDPATDKQLRRMVGGPWDDPVNQQKVQPKTN